MICTPAFLIVILFTATTHTQVMEVDLMDFDNDKICVFLCPRNKNGWRDACNEHYYGQHGNWYEEIDEDELINK